MWHAIPIKLSPHFSTLIKHPQLTDTSDTTEYLIKQTRSRAR